MCSGVLQHLRWEEDSVSPCLAGPFLLAIDIFPETFTLLEGSKGLTDA